VTQNFGNYVFQKIGSEEFLNLGSTRKVVYVAVPFINVNSKETVKTRNSHLGGGLPFRSHLQMPLFEWVESYAAKTRVKRRKVEVCIREEDAPPSLLG